MKNTKNLSKYTLLLGVSGAAIGVSDKADASIVYQNVNLPINSTTSFQSITMDGTTFGFTFSGEQQPSVPYWNFSRVTASAGTGGSFVTSINSYIQNLSLNTPINGSSSFFLTQGMLNGLNNTSPSLGEFNNLNGYLGVQFTGSSGTVYGWIGYTGTIGVNGDSLPSDGTITGFAYETTGAAINAGDMGAVPEPSTLGMLAAGAAGLAFMRSRRKKAA